MQKRLSNKGFTLVETIIVMVLVTLMVMMGYYIFEIVMKSYQTTSDQVSAQENFRLVADHLIEELGHASYVTLLPDAATMPSNVTDGGILVYLDDVDGATKAVFQQSYDAVSSSFVDPEIIGYPVDDLNIVFYAMDNSAKILSFEYAAKEYDVASKYLVENILLQNTPLQDITLASRYGAVYYHYTPN